jgi:mRNA interferase YafQ
MYRVFLSNRYKKSLKRAKQFRNFDQVEVESVVKILEQGRELDARYYDHELKGEYAGIRECHVKNNLLLLYQKREKVLVLLLVDIGTHASVFGK